MLEPGFYNMDCMEAMKQFPDKFFDLAIVDPPYGDAGTVFQGNGGSRFGGRFDRYKKDDKSTKLVYRTGGTWATKYGKKILDWDIAPGEEYFQELFRVSKNQIVWGGNYFQLPPTRCFVIWKKLTISEDFSMSMAEYAWTSFNGNAKLFECAPQGNANEPRIHACQKPVKLYSWLLSRFANEGDKILDTHVGSASSLVACHRGGFDAWGFEIDPDYYQKAKERLDRETAQVTMYDLLEGVRGTGNDATAQDI